MNTTIALRSIACAMAWRTRMSSSGLTVTLSESADSSPGSIALTLTPGSFGRAVHPRLVLLAVDHVELAGLEGEVARGIGGHVAVRDLLQRRRAAEVLLVGGELHVLLRLVLGEHERPGADRLLGEVLAHLLGRLLADHVAAVDVRDVAQESRHRVLERDLERVLVDRLDLVDGVEVVRVRRRRLVARRA